MAPFLTIGMAFMCPSAINRNPSHAQYVRLSKEQTATKSSVVDYAVVNKLGDNFHKLYSYLDYKEGWNGYNGKKFSKKTIDRTLSILKKLRLQPQIFPTGRGSVQLEYHFDDDNMVEMEVSSDGITAYWVIRGDESEEEISNVFVAYKKLNEFAC